MSTYLHSLPGSVSTFAFVLQVNTIQKTSCTGQAKRKNLNAASKFVNTQIGTSRKKRSVNEILNTAKLQVECLFTICIIKRRQALLRLQLTPYNGIVRTRHVVRHKTVHRKKTVFPFPHEKKKKTTQLSLTFLPNSSISLALVMYNSRSWAFRSLLFCNSRRAWAMDNSNWSGSEPPFFTILELTMTGICEQNEIDT